MKSLNIIYMGTPDFAVAPLAALLASKHNVKAVVTVPDKPAGRGRKLQQSAVKKFAVENNIPVLQPEKLREENFVKTLQNYAPDLMVVVAFRMLPEVVWRIPKIGTFNLHASLLPQYRGAAPINWAVMNGEKESGVTTFFIDNKIDTGNILLQKSIPLSKKETAGTLHDKLMELGAALVVKTTNELAEGKIDPKPQDESDAIKPAPKLFREQCAIDWKKPGEEIERQIRGLSPYPAAFFFAEGDDFSGEIKVLEAEFSEQPASKNIQTMWAEGKSLKIAVNGGVLLLFKIKPQGKRAMQAIDFINGWKDKNAELMVK